MQLLKTRDSVFSPHLALFAEDYQMPNANDDSILPDKQINAFFNGIGDEFAQTMGDLVSAGAMQMAQDLAEADATKINQYSWKVQRPLEDLLWNLWSGGWEAAQSYGHQELEKIIVRQNSAQMNWGYDLAEFDRRMNRRFKPDVKLGMPGQLIGRRSAPENIGRIAPLRKGYLEQAIRDRVALLSEDVSQDLIGEIKDHLRAWKGIEPDNPNYSQRWGSGQINKTTMYDRIRETLEGDPDQADKGGVYARGKTIGVTEASGVLALGKLHSYKDLERASGGKYRIRRVRYQTKEYAYPRPDKQRPCMKCIPKNGHILDLETQWDLIMTTYLIPGHGMCRCYWLPVLEKSDEEGKFLATISRVAGAAVGEPLGEKWVGLAFDEAGRIFMPEAAQAEAKRRMDRTRQVKRREQLARAGSIAAVSLSFAGLVYQFFQHWNSQQTTGMPGEGTLADAMRQASQDLGRTVGEAIAQQFTPQQVPISQVLNPQRVTAIAGANVDLSRVSLKYLQSLGMDEANAQRAQALLKNYVGWLNSQPRVTIGGVNLNTASVPDLVATRLFSPKEAQAIVDYTQRGNMLTSLLDLKKVVDGKAKPVFTKNQVNRFASYYLNTNINDPSLKTPQDLTNRFRISPKQAERILTARDAGQFANAADLERRIADGMRAEGRSDAYAKQEAMRIVETLQAQGGRIDGAQQDPLPRLSMLETVPVMLPGQDLTARTTPIVRVAGAPPLPVTPDPAIEQENLRALLLSRNRPAEIRGEKAMLDQLVQRKLITQAGAGFQQKLQAQANRFAKQQEAATQALNRYQAYTDRAQRIVNDAETLMAQVDQVLSMDNPDLLANASDAIDTTLNQMGGLRNEWNADTQQSLDPMNNTLQLTQNWVRKDGTVEPPLRAQIITGAERVMVEDAIEGGKLTGKRTWILNNVESYQRDLYRPGAVAAVGADINALREDAAQLSDLTRGGDINWETLPMVQQIDAQVSALQQARDTLALDVYGQKARLQDAILQLQQRKQQIQRSLAARRPVQPPPQSIPRQAPTEPAPGQYPTFDQQKRAEVETAIRTAEGFDFNAVESQISRLETRTRVVQERKRIAERRLSATEKEQLSAAYERMTTDPSNPAYDYFVRSQTYPVSNFPARVQRMFNTYENKLFDALLEGNQNKMDKLRDSYMEKMADTTAQDIVNEKWNDLSTVLSYLRTEIGRVNPELISSTEFGEIERAINQAEAMLPAENDVSLWAESPQIRRRIANIRDRITQLRQRLSDAANAASDVTFRRLLRVATFRRRPKLLSARFR